MDREDDDEKLQADPRFRKLAALLQGRPRSAVERFLSYCRDLPELSPASPKKGKKFESERDKLSVTIDAELLELVEETAESMGVPVSRVVESAIWKYYNKPLLSFQKESEDEPPK